MCACGITLREIIKFCILLKYNYEVETVVVYNNVHTSTHVIHKQYVLQKNSKVNKGELIWWKVDIELSVCMKKKKRSVDSRIVIHDTIEIICMYGTDHG